MGMEGDMWEGWISKWKHGGPRNLDHRDLPLTPAGILFANSFQLLAILITSHFGYLS